MLSVLEMGDKTGYNLTFGKVTDMHATLCRCPPVAVNRFVHACTSNAPLTLTASFGSSPAFSRLACGSHSVVLLCRIVSLLDALEVSETDQSLVVAHSGRPANQYSGSAIGMYCTLGEPSADSKMGCKVVWEGSWLNRLKTKQS